MDGHDSQRIKEIAFQFAVCTRITQEQAETFFIEFIDYINKGYNPYMLIEMMRLKKEGKL